MTEIAPFIVPAKQIYFPLGEMHDLNLKQIITLIRIIFISIS